MMAPGGTPLWALPHLAMWTTSTWYIFALFPILALQAKSSKDMWSQVKSKHKI
jgi:hypothetical protein